jgi:predicted kinase
MRVLVLMRGLPGSGKSTWIKDNGLEAYSLSADNLRLFYQAPQQCPDGTYTISQENNKPVWELILQVLEQRMSRGDFTVIGACHVKPSDFSKYRQLANIVNWPKTTVIECTVLTFQKFLLT